MRQMSSNTPGGARVVVITGAAGALGRSVARQFAAQGARLALLDRDQAALDALFPDAALRLALDITDGAASDAAIAQVVQAFGRIDALVHVAGGFEMGEATHELSRAAWDRMMNLNAWSFVNLSRGVVAQMLRQRSGRIVAVSAASAREGAARMAAYVASKSALQRLVESLAHEVRSQGIHVNSVAPTTMDTPANRSAMPEADRSAWVGTDDAAATIVFLASEAAPVHGQHLRLGA
jgi:NAD(P)-dependent dehydrogenase (short-subunit alcohol dehydrogenase family)